MLAVSNITALEKFLTSCSIFFKPHFSRPVLSSHARALSISIEPTIAQIISLVRIPYPSTSSPKILTNVPGISFLVLKWPSTPIPLSFSPSINPAHEYSWQVIKLGARLDALVSAYPISCTTIASPLSCTLIPESNPPSASVNSVLTSTYRPGLPPSAFLPALPPEGFPLIAICVSSRNFNPPFLFSS